MKQEEYSNTQLIRYLRLYWRMLRMSFMRRTANPLGFFLLMFAVTAEMILILIFARVTFAYIPHLGALTQGQLFWIVGTSMAIDALSWLSFRSGSYRITNNVQRGSFDQFMTKPISSRFISMFARMDFEDVTRIVVAGVLVYPYLDAVGSPIILHIILYIVSLLAALIALYSTLSSICALSFIFVNVDGLFFLNDELFRLARYPHTVYNKFLQWLFLTVIPVGLLASVPTLVLTSEHPWYYALPLIIWGLVFLWLSRKFWNWAIKKYSGASS